ncbi:MAG: ABC transporter ATP-binding protein [Candidatus Eremiobacteraeota bacterium]|nr:ABC transporter ATP-binding protein [Candidatus Eremiobacteraeota bacterium]
MEIAIKTENLVKIYPGKGKSRGKPVKALVDLNLQVKVGDIYGFIGPNGAGKTTCIKTLMGLIRPTSGKAFIFDMVAGTVEAKKKVGYLSEVAYYYPFMEVGKLLDFYCSFYNIPRAKRKKKITEVLGLVKLSNKTNARMSELSKGMMQRFGIAQAIIADPPLLILDELTSGLDPIAQKEVKDIILDLKKRGKTIFFSSHVMTEVEKICDQIGIINQGVMLKSAGLEDFLKEESGAFTRIVFGGKPDKLLESFKEKGLEIDNVSTGIFAVVVPDNDVGEIIDTLRNEKGNIIEIKPRRFSLEDAFFKLVKERDEKQQKGSEIKEKQEV